MDDQQDHDALTPETEPLRPPEWFERIAEAADLLDVTAERCPFCAGAENMCPRCLYLATQAEALRAFAAALIEQDTPPIHLTNPSDN